jgi:hypothetical protein
MTKAKWLVVSLGLALPGGVFAADGVAVQHSEPLFAYRVAARTDDAAKPSGAMPEISFNAFGRDFALRLEPNARLAALEAGLDLPPGVRAYRGELAGRPGSWARIVLTPDGPIGIVYDGDTFYGLETGSDTATSSSAPTIFRLADVYVAPGALSCGRAGRWRPRTRDARRGTHAARSGWRNVEPRHRRRRRFRVRAELRC